MGTYCVSAPRAPVRRIHIHFPLVAHGVAYRTINCTRVNCKMLTVHCAFWVLGRHYSPLYRRYALVESSAPPLLLRPPRPPPMPCCPPREMVLRTYGYILSYWIVSHLTSQIIHHPSFTLYHLTVRNRNL
jgi:hypothetical protein